MTQSAVEPSNLKSFQRISQEDVRYLKELGKSSAFASQCHDSDKLHGKGQPFDLRKFTSYKQVFNLIKGSVDKLLYENVPSHDVYASRE